jgi:hypothetical protein
MTYVPSLLLLECLWVCVGDSRLAVLLICCSLGCWLIDEAAAEQQ